MSSSRAANNPRFWSFASNRAVQIFAAATVLSLVVAAAMGAGGFPFDRPAVGTTDRAQNINMQIVQIVFALVLIALVFIPVVQILAFEKSLRNDRYAHGSGHWDGRVLIYR